MNFSVRSTAISPHLTEVRVSLFDEVDSWHTLLDEFISLTSSWPEDDTSNLGNPRAASDNFQ